MDWTPIAKGTLLDLITAAENRMDLQLLRFWAAIKIAPEKWRERAYGAPGGGFWAVAIVGRKVVWYNDIEDGFNCSAYSLIGELAEYACNQDQLDIAVRNLRTSIESGQDNTLRYSPPVAHMKCMHNPPHPGELLKEYLGDVTVSRAAMHLGVGRGTIRRIIAGTSSISPDMAYRLSAAFGTSPDLWAGLQLQYDLHKAEKLPRPTIERIAPQTPFSAPRRAD